MEKSIQIIYTSEAEERLEKLMNKLKSDIEFSIKNRRYIPGDKLLEITGSDIETISKHLKIISPEKIYIRETLIKSYLIFGTILITVGLFYDEFRNLLLEQNRLQLILIFLGVILIITALLLKSVVNRIKYKYNIDDVK